MVIFLTLHTSSVLHSKSKAHYFCDYLDSSGTLFHMNDYLNTQLGSCCSYLEGISRRKVSQTKQSNVFLTGKLNYYHFDIQKQVDYSP